MVPLERLALAFDTLGDDSLQSRFAEFLDDYESFLAAKSFAELNEPNPDTKEEFRTKADRFGGLLYDAVMNEKIDPYLRRFVLI